MGARFCSLNREIHYIEVHYIEVCYIKVCTCTQLCCQHQIEGFVFYTSLQLVSYCNHNLTINMTSKKELEKVVNLLVCLKIFQNKTYIFTLLTQPVQSLSVQFTFLTYVSLSTSRATHPFSMTIFVFFRNQAKNERKTFVMESHG